MEGIISSPIGLIHTITASIAVISGTLVLIARKGTKTHKKIGYVYAINMLLLNITAFGIYRLFGSFGVFHVLALVSLFALIFGMYPVLFRNRVKNWYLQHLKVMLWSVVGLYAALAAEISVRFVPAAYFLETVSISSLLITGVGAFFIYRRFFREKRNLERQG